MEQVSENHKVLKLDSRDNVLVALTTLSAGEIISFDGKNIKLPASVPAKHKFVESDMTTGAQITMYGVTVGKLTADLPAGAVLSTKNLRHETNGFSAERHHSEWSAPNVSRWQQRTFEGYHRADGQVGTRNYWIVLPLVFCENRNVEQMREAFEEELGYGRPTPLSPAGAAPRSVAIARSARRPLRPPPLNAERLFTNLDGISFSLHQGRLRRHAPGRTRTLRPAGRIHSSSQRRGSNRARASAARTHEVPDPAGRASRPRSRVAASPF